MAAYKSVENKYLYKPIMRIEGGDCLLKTQDFANL